MVKLGGSTTDDAFIALADAQPGDGDTDDGRKFVLYARNATSGNVVSGMSNVLSGYWWNGAASVQSAIELETKVQASDGNPQFWIEKIFDGSSTPFIKMFMTGASAGAVVTNNDTTSSLAFGAYDVDNTQYRYFATLLSGNTPSFTIAPPSGGTVAVTGTTLGFVSYLESSETTAPSAPAANGFRIYAVDAGGKTQIRALFATGASQLIAAEP